MRHMAREKTMLSYLGLPRGVPIPNMSTQVPPSKKRKIDHVAPAPKVEERVEDFTSDVLVCHSARNSTFNSTCIDEHHLCCINCSTDQKATTTFHEKKQPLDEPKKPPVEASIPELDIATGSNRKIAS
jgi:hypothetical protein